MLSRLAELAWRLMLSQSTGGGAALPEDGAQIPERGDLEVCPVSCAAAHRVALHDGAQRAQQRPGRFEGQTSTPYCWAVQVQLSCIHTCLLTPQ